MHAPRFAGCAALLAGAACVEVRALHRLHVLPRAVFVAEPQASGETGQALRGRSGRFDDRRPHMNSLFILAGLACGFAEPPADKWEPLKKSAHAFLDALKKEDFEAATKDFNAAMKKGVPKEQLAELWKALNKQLGPFKGVGTPRTE